MLKNRKSANYWNIHYLKGYNGKKNTELSLFSPWKRAHIRTILEARRNCHDTIIRIAFA